MCKPIPIPSPMPGPEPGMPKVDTLKLCPTCRRSTLYIPDEWDDNGIQIKKKHWKCIWCLVDYEPDDPRLITAVVRKPEPWPLLDRYEEIGDEWDDDFGRDEW